jgi:biopolymer transport protein ExbB
VLLRLRAGWAFRSQTRAFRQRLQATPANQPLSALASGRDPHARLVQAGLLAADALGTSPGPGSSTERLEWVERELAHAVEQELERMETGMSGLASIASTAPFVGLFGTVWGIYHALIRIGQTGQSSLDQVAGPVGEALIMTALGLAVAIPAAMAHTAFLKQWRRAGSELRDSAHQLGTRLAGVRAG